MHTAEQLELQEHPTQVMRALPLKKTDTLPRKFLSLLFLLGACCVITLYLVIPLMLFLNIFQDWIEQLLGAVLILTVGEFIVFSVLIKTSKIAKAKTSNATNIEHVTKHMDHNVLWQIEEDGQYMVPFDELINTPTVNVAALKNENPLFNEIAMSMAALKRSSSSSSSSKLPLMDFDIDLDQEPTREQDKVTVS